MLSIKNNQQENKIMAILKTTPISTAAFGAWWLKNINIYKISDTATNLNVAFIPYNGEYALNTTPSRLTLEVNAKKASDSTFADVMNALTTEVQRQYGLKNGNPTITTFEIKNLNVMAQNPERPVAIFCQLIVNGVTKTLMISDAFSLAGTDMTFAVALNNVMNEFGRQGKLAGKID